MKKNASDSFTPAKAQQVLAGAMTKKEVVREFRFESSSTPGTFYVTKVYRDASMSCNCKGWIFSARKNNGIRKCRHTEEVAGAMDDRTIRFNIKTSAAPKKKQQAEPQQAPVPVTVVLARPTRRFSFED